MKTLRVPALLVLGVLLTLPATGQAQMCGTKKRHPRTYEHVIWIWLENHGYEEIIGSPNAPYTNSLTASCGSATNFHNLTHFSLPNYVGAVTGLGLTELQPFLLDCNPGPTCQTAATSIFHQVTSWKAYQESMPSNCALTGFSPYGVRHNPPVYLSSLTGCSTFDVPYTDLQADLDNDTLPAFAFVTPNNINNGHDGAEPGATQNGDNWLQTELPKITSSAAYQSGNTVVFITWDEGEFGPGFSVGEDCAARTNTDSSCHIALLVVSPYTKPGKSTSRFYNHYSLLRTTEQLLGLPRSDVPGLGRNARSFRGAFRL